MGYIKVLDCTLRDGGYCNEWNFGYKNIQKIVHNLIEANIDIIECGFITNKINSYNHDISRFRSFTDCSEVIDNKTNKQLFVCMINYGEFSLSEIPPLEDTRLDGIRIAFHKKNVYEALKFCQGIKEKGYKIFIQAMVSLNYTDKEFIDLITEVNEIDPFAFYIVDSFGVMKRKDLIRLFYMVEHNLNEEIAIGYHSHNNMQLSYSNAQAIVDIRSKHNIIIDSSIFGMGRGAGNLNTELFVEYLNDNFNTNYRLKPLLNVIDEILNNFYHEKYWGYSLPNYLSAKHNTHPNYASYLDSKKTLTVENMDEIFYMMEDSKRSSFDKEYIENLYVKYLEVGNSKEEHLNELQNKLSGKPVLIIAPGRSSIDEKDRILTLVNNEKLTTISINFNYSVINTDFIFISNLRRFRELNESEYHKCIVTSNIQTDNVYLRTNYSVLLNDIDTIRDNAGMMLIKFLYKLGVNKIYIAGLDGYSVDPTQNFIDQKMNLYTQKSLYESMNMGMIQFLSEYKNKVNIEFITTPKHIII